MAKKQTDLPEELREAVFEAARAGAAEAYTQNTGYVNYFKAMETLLYNYKKLAALVADEEAYCDVEYHAGRKTFSATPQAKGFIQHKTEAGRLRAEGVKAGVPDLCLPVARGQYHGLYIELKRQRGGRTSDHQSEWLDALSAQGYKAALCYGWEQAAKTIIEYLTGGGTHG